MFFTILAPLVILLCGLIVPIIIAVLVCQDARKRQGCTPWAKVVIVVALVLAAIFFLTLALGILQYIPDGKEITEIRI